MYTLTQLVIAVVLTALLVVFGVGLLALWVEDAIRRSAWCAGYAAGYDHGADDERQDMQHLINYLLGQTDGPESLAEAEALQIVNRLWRE